MPPASHGAGRRPARRVGGRHERPPPTSGWNTVSANRAGGVAPGAGVAVGDVAGEGRGVARRSSRSVRSPTRRSTGRRGRAAAPGCRRCAPRCVCSSPGCSVQSHSSTTSGGSVPATSSARPPRGPRHSTGACPAAVTVSRCGRSTSTSTGQTDAERVADPQQGGDARVAVAVLDVDQHPAADAGPVGQLVERPAAGGPVLPDPLTDQLVDRDHVRSHRVPRRSPARLPHEVQDTASARNGAAVIDTDLPAAPDVPASWPAAFAACLASVTEVPVTELPLPAGDLAPGPRRLAQLAGRTRLRPGAHRRPDPFQWAGWWIASCESADPADGRRGRSRPWPSARRRASCSARRTRRCSAGPPRTCRSPRPTPSPRSTPCCRPAPAGAGADRHRGGAGRRARRRGRHAAARGRHRPRRPRPGR